jgi:hypothetical protein
MDDTNKMSAQQAEDAIAWLERHWKGKRECPICGSNNWHVGEHFVTPTVIAPNGGLVLGGTSYPHFIVTSTDCGYAILINAVIAGIFRAPEANSDG